MGKTVFSKGSAAGARGSRAWRRWGLLSVVGLLAVLAPATTSQAVLGGFESGDGDLDHDATTDWNDFDGATPAGFDDLTTVPDRTGNPDDIFDGGVKQDQECPGTKDGSLGGGGSKFDIKRLYLTHADVGGVDFLYLAWVRVPQNSTSASSHVAFEFNSSEEFCSNGAGLVRRTAGDKLLVYDFEGGSAAPALKLLTWKTSGSCEVANNTAPCWGNPQNLNSANSEARVNIASIGPVLDELPTPDETLGVVEFGEAGINLTAAVGEENICAFSGRVTGVARSSGNSGTAQMKDKVGPAEFELPGCVAEPTITTEISLNDHATLIGFGTEGVGDPMGSLTFSLYGPEDDECAGDPVYETTITDIDSGGPWSTADGDNPDASYTVPSDAPGTYNWVVEYSGDEFNAPATSLCGDETAVVTYGS